MSASAIILLPSVFIPSSAFYPFISRLIRLLSPPSADLFFFPLLTLLSPSHPPSSSPSAESSAFPPPIHQLIRLLSPNPSTHPPFISPSADSSAFYPPPPPPPVRRLIRLLSLHPSFIPSSAVRIRRTIRHLYSLFILTHAKMWSVVVTCVLYIFAKSANSNF